MNRKQLTWVGLIIVVVIFSLMRARYEDPIICFLKGGGMLLGIYVLTLVKKT